MRYGPTKNVVRLAIKLQGAPRGLTIEEIQNEVGGSRRTAERMKNAVEECFDTLHAVESDDRKAHWRLESRALRGLVRITPEELAEMSPMTEALERTGHTERAAAARALADKLRVLLPCRPEPGEPDEALEALLRSEGLAMRAGPRPRLEPGLPGLLREAIFTRRVVEFDYRSPNRTEPKTFAAHPHGVLYGGRPHLVARADWADDLRLWRLDRIRGARVTDKPFTPAPDFDLEDYARRSFGTYQEPPVPVVLRFDAAVADDAEGFLFHPSQTVERHLDGTVTVRFEAGGLQEMAWHLFTWGSSVTVEQPRSLRDRLAGLCAELAAHHAR